MVVQIISEYTKFSALAFVVTELLPHKIKIQGGPFEGPLMIVKKVVLIL